MTTKVIGIDDITIDPRCQQRELDRENIARLAELLTEGGEFNDAIEVFHDGENHFLAHGFHRYHAYMQASIDAVEAVIHKGDIEAAIDFSCKPLNSEHGAPETRADRERRVRRMIERHTDWADKRIGDHCGVSNHTVKRYRDDMESKWQIATCETRERSNGTTYPATKPRKPATETTTEIINKDTGEVIDNPVTVKTTEKRGGIAPNAMTPVRGHSRPDEKVTVSLPRNPEIVANTLKSFFGVEFIRQLIASLQDIAGD